MVRKKLKEEPSLDLTPLIDIILQLVIFFVLTTTFVPHLIEVNLPKASSSPVREERMVVITLTRDGRIFWDREEVNLPEIIRRVEDTDRVSYIIRADEGVPYGSVIKLLNELKKAGVRRLGLVVEPER